MRCLRGHWDDEHDEGCIYTERERGESEVEVVEERDAREEMDTPQW